MIVVYKQWDCWLNAPPSNPYTSQTGALTLKAFSKAFRWKYIWYREGFPLISPRAVHSRASPPQSTPGKVSKWRRLRYSWYFFEVQKKASWHDLIGAHSKSRDKSILLLSKLFSTDVRFQSFVDTGAFLSPMLCKLQVTFTLYIIPYYLPPSPPRWRRPPNRVKLPLVGRLVMHFFRHVYGSTVGICSVLAAGRVYTRYDRFHVRRALPFRAPVFIFLVDKFDTNLRSEASLFLRICGRFREFKTWNLLRAFIRGP